MEGREKKNYTEVLEENDRRNVFNLKCYTEKNHSCRTLQREQLFYSALLGDVAQDTMAADTWDRDKVV